MALYSNSQQQTWNKSVLQFQAATFPLTFAPHTYPKNQQAMSEVSNRYVVIMAGGLGSRFWPSSREAKPKQFLDLLGTGKSLLRLTFERFLSLVPKENILVVTHRDYLALTQEHLPELAAAQILTEPSRKNTAPCAAYAAGQIALLHPEASFVLAPADHVILKEVEFVKKLETALHFAERQAAIVTLGITPTRPDTGYGYIQSAAAVEDEVFKVQRFTEKPNAATAEQFLSDGGYLWNAGIFVSRATVMLQAFSEHSPEVYSLFAPTAVAERLRQEPDFVVEQYAACPSISIDYAIMEKADNVFTVPANVGWTDLGTWASLYAELPKDDNGNLLIGGEGLLYDTTKSIIRTYDNKLVVVRGLEDYIVIDDRDVLLIYPKNKEQEIRGVVNDAKENFAGLFN